MHCYIINSNSLALLLLLLALGGSRTVATLESEKPTELLLPLMSLERKEEKLRFSIIIKHCKSGKFNYPSKHNQLVTQHL